MLNCFSISFRLSGSRTSTCDGCLFHLEPRTTETGDCHRGVTEVVSAVEDQGQSGSCSALSASQAVVSRLVLSSSGFRVNFSGYTLMRQSTQLPQNFTQFLHECGLSHTLASGHYFHVALVSGSHLPGASPQEYKKLVFHACFWTLFPMCPLGHLISTRCFCFLVRIHVHVSVHGASRNGSPHFPREGGLRIPRLTLVGPVHRYRTG